MDVGTLLLLVGVVAFLLAIVAAARRVLRDSQAAMRTDEAPPTDEARRSSTPRESRLLELRNRALTGLCRYCDEEAAHQMPTLRQVRHPLEPILRFLNATPNARWVVQVERKSDILPELCMHHRDAMVGLFVERVGRERLAYARWVNEQRGEMFEFERWGADERLSGEMAAMRRGRPRKGNEQVLSLVRPKKNGVAGDG